MTQLYTPERIITSAPQVQDITTGVVSEPVALEEVKNLLSIGHDLQDDSLLLMITSVRELIENYCKVSLVEKSLRFYYERFGCKIRLQHGPHITISEVKTIDREGTGTELALNTDYYARGLNFKLLEFKPTVQITSGCPNSLQIECSVGYTSATIPKVFKQAIMKQMAWDYDGNRGEIETEYRNVLSPEVEKMIALERKVINL